MRAKAKSVLLAMLIVVLCVCAVVCVACNDDKDPVDNPNGDNNNITSTTTPSKIKDIADVEVDLYGDDLLKKDREVSYTLTDYVKDANAQGTSYELVAGSEAIAVGKVKNNKFSVTVKTVGEHTFTLKVNQNNAEVFSLAGKVVVSDSSKYGIANGGFESGDLTGWTVSENSGYVSASNVTFFDWLTPVPTINQEGVYYLDGYNQADGFSGEGLTGTVQSSDFIVGGSRWITFMLGGGSHSGLRVELVDKESDKTIATFNNYLFADPSRSLNLTKYAYRINESYMGKTMFIRIRDDVTEGSFRSITADSFCTYYPEGKEPQIDNEIIFEASYAKSKLIVHLDLDNATRALPNGDFETGDLTGWMGDSAYAISDASTFFEAFFPDNIPSYNKQGTYFVSTEADYDAMGTLTSKAFVVGGNRVISFKLGGNKTKNLYVSLMKYVEGGDDVEIAKFNNTMFSDPYRSFALTTYVYTIPAEYENEKCYFVLHDEADSSTSFGVINADDFKTDYQDADVPKVDGINVFNAGYMQTAIADLDEKLGLDTATKELRNGDFETGDLTGWFTSDLADSYKVRTEGEYFESYYALNIPIYAVDGQYHLSGWKSGEDESGLDAMGVMYSQAFIVDGTGWITFKMGGTNNEKIYMQLMHYVEDGDDEVVATFNNYLFTDPYRSFGMTTYGYKIDASLKGEKCYFKLVDNADSSVTFSAITLDSVKTYYESEITLYEGNPIAITNEITSKKLSDDTNIYPASYVRATVTNIVEKLGLDSATYELRNGNFETGDLTGWFTDPAGAISYAISDQKKYFENYYPDNPPIYNQEGEYFLNGYTNELYTGEVYSQAFIVGGTRWITFRIGGNCTENLQFKLMAYVDGKNDVEIAKFNNYLFSDPYRSFAMTEYAYQIPEEYLGRKCYFIISDESTSNFGAITLDNVITYYETAPNVYYGTAGTNSVDDGRIYQAGYVTA